MHKSIVFFLSFLANLDIETADIYGDFEYEGSFTDAITRTYIDDVENVIELSTRDVPVADGKKELVKAFMQDGKIVLLVQKGINWTPTLYQAVGNAIALAMQKGETNELVTGAFAYYDEFETEMVYLTQQDGTWRGFVATTITDVQIDLENKFALYSRDTFLAIGLDLIDISNELVGGTEWKLFKDAKQPTETGLSHKARLMRAVTTETRALLQESGSQFAFGDNYSPIASGEVNGMPLISLDAERAKQGKLNVVFRKDGGKATIQRNVGFASIIPANSGMHDYYKQATLRTGTDG